MQSLIDFQKNQPNAQASGFPAAKVNGDNLSQKTEMPIIFPSTYPGSSFDQYDQKILLWPERLSHEELRNVTWEAWIVDTPVIIRSIGTQLLETAQAISTIIPNAFVESDMPYSDLIIISGDSSSISEVTRRLNDHPLLYRITEYSNEFLDEARQSWKILVEQLEGKEISISTNPPEQKIYIRNIWISHIVWGYREPNSMVQVDLYRKNRHIFSVSRESDSSGYFYTFIDTNILGADRLVITINGLVETITVPELSFKLDPSTNMLTGTITELGGNNHSESIRVVIGNNWEDVSVNDQGEFLADFSDVEIRAGTEGYLEYVDINGNVTFLAMHTPIINIRRNTSFGLPYGGTHSSGISSIVWGYTSSNNGLVVQLERSESILAAREVIADYDGSFIVSVDRLIEDGDIIRVLNDTEEVIVSVPTMTYLADGSQKSIRGNAPANINTLESGAPHSLQLSLGYNDQQVLTSADGEFIATFTDNNYIAGLVGTMRYTNSDGNRIYKPIFAADPLIRSKYGDWRADVIIGQPDFNQISPNEIVGNHIFNPTGVYVDRTVKPNRVYVWDAGNSRVLGLSHLGTCETGVNSGQACTASSDCPGSICRIHEDRIADIVLGQSGFNTSACNGDSGYQLYPDVVMASAASLCGMREEQNSISEASSGATMVVDDQGNLYVPDYYNNRVLRYNNPFETDTIADYVWGQDDFAGTTCNRGQGYFAHADAKSLCLASRPGGDFSAGVDIGVEGNLWVADDQNNRVLRFPFDPDVGHPAQIADLVLGQPDFYTIVYGSDPHQMYYPGSVRVTDGGTVYVADTRNHRILAFEPPITNGMPATRIIESGSGEPRGLEIDPSGGLWVNEVESDQAVHYVNDVLMDVVPTGRYTMGGPGVDDDGNLLIANWRQQGLHYTAPDYELDAYFLRNESDEELFNQTGPRGIYGGNSMEIAAGQLIYSDFSRILFWNNPWWLTNYQEADGVIGEEDFYTRHRWNWFTRMRASENGLLWVVKGGIWQGADIIAYELPLKNGAEPVITLAQPISVQGGGDFYWTESLIFGTGIAFQSECDCLWLSDRDYNRVFRIRDVSTDPTVDIVIGQSDLSGTHCNQGRDVDDIYVHPQHPSRDSLCFPGPLEIDRKGNLWVADHNSEVAGNWRLLQYDAASIPDSPTIAVFGIPASRVYGRAGDFNEPDCLQLHEDPICGPWETAFDSQGRMVIGFNGYLGPRFPMVYQNPLENPFPVAAIADYHSMPTTLRFDQFDNLYILDGNRSRILIYHSQVVPENRIFLPLVTR